MGVEGYPVGLVKQSDAVTWHTVKRVAVAQEVERVVHKITALVV